MPAKSVSKAMVESRLAAEARAFDAANRGSHSFGPIWEEPDNPHCNWSSTLSCRGSKISRGKMREALERVQKKYPIVDFRWRRGAGAD